MKKCIALLLALILLLSLAACSEPGTAQTDSAPSQTRQNSPDSGAEPSAEPASDSPETTLPAEPATESPAPELPERFEEITAVDNDQCSVKITGVELDSLWGYTLKLQLENKSDSKTYMFAVDSAAVNGVSWDPFFAVELEPGLKKNGAINFADAEKEALIRSFTDIELVFRIYDSKDWAADDLVRETVHVYPLGQERAERYVRAPQPDDVVLADNDQITVILTGFDTHPLWGYTAELYLENKTDAPLVFSAEDVAVNGLLCDPYWAAKLAPGKQGFSGISWSDASLQENGIQQVQTIELTLRVHDAELYDAEDLYAERLTLTPKAQ